MPKTKDAYVVGVDDLVWCVSDPFTITSIAMIRPFAKEGEDAPEFTFWLDTRDGEGVYPAHTDEIFLSQRNCLLAARRIAYGDIQCDENSIKRNRERIDSINDFLGEVD